ncbi:ATG8-interacting protein 1 [Iris pallida]|uniref:ATG8-interacting protein 1 n=1 Tax=Iris pallida TaxID=29817 RepID=A0AAX6IBQ6_IRIPA|nr:ATG8-interacting protein 1 [Iris pallida]
MADNEKEKEVAPPRGADWEVVQLTASTYAASPNPQEIDLDVLRTGKESSSTLFMSGHFVLPPREHEDLPIEPNCTEIIGEAEGQDKGYTEEEDGHGDDIITEESRLVKSDDNSQRTEFFEVGSTLSAPVIEFEEGRVSQGMHSVPYPENTDILDPNDFSTPSDSSPPKHTESSEDDGSNIPSDGWWKSHASSLYRHAKEANMFWSIFVAAALTGLVILGKRWHHVNDEKMNRVLDPINRFKDVIKGSHQRS